MQLLQWATLSPNGPSNLAAIRFSAPIQISLLRIFPRGAAPFDVAPDVVAETAPDAFFLNIYFNAQPLQRNAPQVPGQEQRAPNALVPTSIAYTGGRQDFAIDMGNEYATRLMIVKGDFKVLSMAIYGRVVTEQPPVLSYEPKPLPIVEPYPLSDALDPANSSEPNALAEKLLSLMPDPPQLPLVVRLMFCLKPSEEDWDDPEFPYLYADLDDKDSDFDLEGIVNSISRPVRDDLSQDEFATLVERVNDFLGPKDSDQAYYIAKLLSIAAPQQPEMARALLEHIDFDEIFDETSLGDETTILCLLDACANRDIAQYFSSHNVLGVIKSLQNSSTKEQYVQAAARKLEERLNGWQHFDDALASDTADFQGAVNFLVDLTSEENSTGIWLSCMLLNTDIKLATSSNIPQLPPALTQQHALPKSTDEFVTLVRALIGIVSVLSAWAWADSLGVDVCRERILGVLSLWQKVEGYRDILNHLLHLRQLTRRLGWIISDSNPPRKSGVFAERILMDLAEEPSAILQEELFKTIQDLKQPLSYITEEDRLALRKVSLVAEDGLPAAVEELLFTSDRPFSFRRLRTLRVSIAIVQKEIKEDEDDGELRVLNNLWDEDAHGLIPRLVDLLGDVSSDIVKYFEVEPVLEVNHKLVTQLFNTASDVLRLVRSLSIGYPLPSRYLRSLTMAIQDTCTSSAIVRQLFSASSPVNHAALMAKALGYQILFRLTAEGMRTEVGALNALVVFRTLLRHSTQSNITLDPVRQLRQTLDLVDYLIPNDDDMTEEQGASYWLTSVVPMALPELKAFFELLDLDNKLHLFQRLVQFDEGVVGLGEWLLTEELKVLVDILDDFSNPDVPDDLKLLLRHQIVDVIEFLWKLCDPSFSQIPNWYQEALQSDEDLSANLLAALNALLQCRYTTPSLTHFIQSLVKEPHFFLSDLRFSLLLHLLRIAQSDPTTPGVMDHFMPLLQQLPVAAVTPEPFTIEVGLALASFVQQVSSLAADTAGALITLLEWMVSQENRSFTTLKGIKNEDFGTLCDFCVMLVPEKESVLSGIREKMTIDEDELFATPSVELQQEEVRLSVNAINELVHNGVAGGGKENENRPSTPRAGNKTPDILGMVISPPTALLRSPAATGLTKTYANNDFRQLRQVPSARLNTSRLPSMHVDDFETSSSSPTLLPAPDIVVGPTGYHSILNSPSIGPSLGLGL